MARSKTLIELPKHPSAMTPEELSAELLGEDKATVMRSLILAEVQRMKGGAEQEPRTLRSLWYSLVKPALSRMGLLDERTSGGNKVNWARYLSKHTAELVREGVTTYEELCIIDGSRQRRPAVSVTEAVATVELVGAHYPWLIIFTEKDTLWGVVRNLAALYGVTAISGSGQPSYACTENVLRAIWSKSAYCRDQDIYLLSFTDYDPSGYDIANAQFTQLEELADGYCDVYHRRLGLKPEQLTPEERAENAYKPPRKGLAKWYKETGGVDGQPLGLELDALPLSRVRRMFAEGIEEWIDISERQRDLPRAFVDLLAWEVLEAELEIDAKLEAVRDAVRAGDVWRKLTETEIPAELFKQAAVKGWDSIDPTTTTWGGDPLFDCEAEVRAAMREALNGNE